MRRRAFLQSSAAAMVTMPSFAARAEIASPRWVQITVSSPEDAEPACRFACDLWRVSTALRETQMLAPDGSGLITYALPDNGTLAIRIDPAAVHTRAIVRSQSRTRAFVFDGSAWKPS